MKLEFFDNNTIRPARSGEYYVITKTGKHRFLDYSAKYHAWNASDDPDLYDPNCEIEVVCWAFKPRTDQILMNMIRKGE